MLDALLDHRPPRPLSLVVPSTMMFGICGDRLSGETGVSSNSVTGVSGTGGGFLGRSSWWALFTLSRLECREERFDCLLSRPVWSLGCGGKKLVWLGLGVFRSGRICVQPSLNMSQRSQHAWTAEPRSSSSGGLPSLLFCRRLKSISARLQQALKRWSVSSASSPRCFMSRWQSVI